MKKRPTIRDVAQKAGLSVSTVSLVINNRKNVSDEVREKVRRVVLSLGYHPQRSARGLASGESGNIGFLLTDDHFSRSEPFYTRVFLGTELEARNHNYYVLLTTVGPSPAKSEQIPRFLLEHNVDGVIIAGRIAAQWIDFIRDQRLPIVLVDFNIPEKHVSTVVMDNRSGATSATRHLIEAGHTAIGFIGGDMTHPSIAERYRGYRETLVAAQIVPNDSWVSVDEEDTRLANGYNAARTLLSRTEDHPTALFAANDAMAIGCMNAIREHGLNVPRDIAVVGFDNVEAALHVEPRLTTVNVHREEMGTIAVRRLVENIKSGSTVMTHTVIPVELIVRNSSARPIDPVLSVGARVSVAS